MRFRRKRPEDQIQRTVLQHLKIRAPRDCFFFHPANGGQRSPVEAAILNGLGVRAGVPDLIIIHAGEVFGLELKAEGGGKPTELQLEAQEAMRRAGAKVATATGLDAALKQLESWKLLKGWTS
jgi:hypothetical protein